MVFAFRDLFCSNQYERYFKEEMIRFIYIKIKRNQ